MLLCPLNAVAYLFSMINNIIIDHGKQVGYSINTALLHLLVITEVNYI